MNCYGWKLVGIVQACCCVLVAALSVIAPTAQAALIVDDSWADAGRTNGADALDANWWTSTAPTAIEVSAGSLGLVTGTSGRGIHGTFPAQALNVGDALKVTFAFRTPATVGNNLSAAFKLALFNTLGNAGLAADLTASTGSPNAIYNPLPGYMMDYDVKTTTENIQFREKDPVPGTTGQLLGTTTGFTGLAAGGNAYTFAPNTNYTGTLSVKRTSATDLELTGSLSDGSGLLSTFTTTDTSASATTFDLFAIHSNANVFGTSNVVGAADNGIDFSNIKIETIPVPEASSVGLALVGLLGSLAALRRRGGCS